MGTQSIRPLSLSGKLSSTSETSHRKDIVRGQGGSFRRAVSIDLLTDDALLEIFDFYRNNDEKNQARSNLRVWKWHLLVHVCRRWRQIIFDSPHHLNLRILCPPGTPARKISIWPAFPIIIDGSSLGSRMPNSDSEDNLIAALEHPDRVSYVVLVLTCSQLARMATAMQDPFPALKHLNIWLLIASTDGDAPVLPCEFLGGSAACLQEIFLWNIPYPALPTLLLSASSLVKLILQKIPATGYISPEALVMGLAASPNLKTLIFELQLGYPRHDRIRLPQITRTVLPALTRFDFQGACEYLEDLVAQIDSPQLDQLHIHYLNQLADHPVAQLSKFVDRSVGPKLSLYRHALVIFDSGIISFAIHRRVERPSLHWYPAGTIFSCEGIDWLVSDIAPVFSQFSATLSDVVHVKLEADLVEYLQDTEYIEWLHLFHHFSTVQTLYVYQQLAGGVALTLEDNAGEMATEVLPSLDLICLASEPASSVENFVAARQLSNRPVTVVNTEKEFLERLESYIR